jgi:uncharacterized protein YjbJ (UPF0337 family)
VPAAAVESVHRAASTRGAPFARERALQHRHARLAHRFWQIRRGHTADCAQTIFGRRHDMSLEDKVKGKAKEAEGKLTGDKSRETEGQLEQAKGDAKDAFEHAKDAAENLLDRARDEADRRGDPGARAEDRR